MALAKNTFSSWLVVTLVLGGAFVLGLAIPVLPIGFAFVLILPVIALLYFNQTYDSRIGARTVEYLFPLYVVLSIMWPRYLAFNAGGPDITPTRLMHAILLLAWGWALISPSYRRELFAAVKQNRIFFGLLATYIVWRLITAIFSDVVAISIYQYVNELVAALLMGFITVSAVRTTDQLWRLLHMLMLSALFVIAVAVVEKIIGANPFSHFIFPGFHFSNEYVEQALAAKVRSGSYRVQSTFSHPLLLVEYIAFVLPIAIFVATVSPSRVFRWIGVVVVPSLVIVAAFTGSRSSLVVIIVLLALLALFLLVRAMRMKQYARLGFLISFGVPLALVVIGAIVQWSGFDISIITGRSIDEMNSTHARVVMLDMAIPLVLAHPVLGYGIGLAVDVLGFNAGTQLTIDNYYLTLVLESGLPGLSLFLLLAVVAVLAGAKSKPGTNDDLAFLGGLLVLSIVGMLVVISIFSIPHILPLLIIAETLACRLTSLQKRTV